jgi:hypothetical protein
MAFFETVRADGRPVEIRVTGGDHLWSLWKVAVVDALGFIDARQARLRTHNQKMTVAAMQMALMKVWAQRSYRVAMRRQSLSLPNIRSMRLRCL